MGLRLSLEFFRFVFLENFMKNNLRNSQEKTVCFASFAFRETDSFVYDRDLYFAKQYVLVAFFYKLMMYNTPGI